MVRTLFNDFWSGAYEKPAAFVERLDQAEDYLNERLAASSELWRLDINTRVMLGLPPPGEFRSITLALKAATGQAQRRPDHFQSAGLAAPMPASEVGAGR